jgi:hypothetical protein
LLIKKILFPAINLPQMHITRKKSKVKILENGSKNSKEYKPIKKKKKPQKLKKAYIFTETRI